MKQNTFGIISYLPWSWNEFKMGPFKLICILDEVRWRVLLILMFAGWVSPGLVTNGHSAKKTVKPAEAPEVPMSF